MKRLFLFALLIVMIGANVLFAASVEQYCMVMPPSPDGINDSTYALMAGTGNYIDLLGDAGAKNSITGSKYRIAIAWTKSTDVDTIHVITRTSMDATNWIVIDSQHKVASGQVTHFYSLSDTAATALQRYVQVYVKLAAIDNTNQLIYQNLYGIIYAFDGLGNRKSFYQPQGGFVRARLKE